MHNSTSTVQDKIVNMFVCILKNALSNLVYIKCVYCPPRVVNYKKGLLEDPLLLLDAWRDNKHGDMIGHKYINSLRRDLKMYLNYLSYHFAASCRSQI